MCFSNSLDPDEVFVVYDPEHLKPSMDQVPYIQGLLYLKYLF